MGLFGLELSLIIAWINQQLLPVLYSFLLVFPFVCISSFLSYYTGMQTSKWAVKFKDWKHKIQGLTITCYILIALLGLLPIIIVMIVFGVTNVSLLPNGNMGPFNAIGLIVFYISFKVLNMGFLIVNNQPYHHSKKTLNQKRSKHGR